MTEVTDEEFKRLLRNDPQLNTDFSNKIDEFESMDMDRQQAYTTARNFILARTGSSDTERPDHLTRDFGPSTDLRANYMWVNDNLEGDPDWESCPSNGSRNMYHHIKGSSQRVAKFYGDLQKVLPSGTERTELTRLQDDGRKSLTLLNKILTAESNKRAVAGEMVDDLELEL